MKKSEYLNTVFHGNCVEEMQRLPKACVDLVITDPPFGIKFRAQKQNYHRTASRVIDGYSEVNGNDYEEFTRRWLTEVKRVMKADASMYIFSGWNYLKEILTALDDVGFVTVNHLVWKYQFGVVTKRKYVTSHYHCLYVCLNESRRKFYPYSRFSRRQRTPDGGSAHYRDKEDVWTVNREYWNGDIKTPTKLPAEVIKKILAYSSRKGDVVLDPFLGSGQVAVVAKMEQRNYIGCEIVKAYVRFIERRLALNQYRIKAARP